MLVEKNPKISIVIPCYNVEKYIAKCIDSVINQTYGNLEIICINDGSTDRTLSLIENFRIGDKRIVLIDQENKGLSTTRNLGIEKSTGEYILFVDSDDWLEYDCLERILNVQGQYDVICFPYYSDFKNISLSKRFGINGSFPASTLQRKIVGPIDNEVRNIEKLDSLATVWGKLYRLDVIKAIEFHEVKEIGTWEDGIFNLRVLENCNNSYILDVPLYHYRRDNENSYTSKAKIDLYKKWARKYEIITDIITNKDQNFKKALENRIAISILGLSLTELKSKKSMKEKYFSIKNILSAAPYSQALKKLDISPLPLKWKVFYWLAKRDLVAGVFIISLLIKRVQKLKNI